MSQLCQDIIAYIMVGCVWMPFILALLCLSVLVVIDTIKTEKLKKEFYYKLPYVYRQVIDSYNSQKFVFFKQYGRDCFIINSSAEFKEYETNTKKFVDEEL